MSATAVKRYTRLEGIELGESRESSLKVKIGGVWHWVPRAVVNRTTKNVGATDSDEIVLEEWYARSRGWV